MKPHKMHIVDKGGTKTLCGLLVAPGGLDLNQGLCRNCHRVTKPGDRLAALEKGADGLWRPVPLTTTYTISYPVTYQVGTTTANWYWTPNA